MTVGERIKQKRIELNLSQDELAKKVGYKSRSSIQKIENARKLPLDKVQIMAVALDCTPSYLMGWEDEAGEKTIHGELTEAYVKSSEDRELLDRYHNVSPETRNSIDLLIEADLRKRGLMD